MSSKRDIQVIKFTFLAVVASVAGWMVFNGLTTLFSLNNLSPFVSIALGLFVAWAMFKLKL